MRTDNDASADMSKQSSKGKPQSSPPRTPVIPTAAARRNRYSRGERLRKLEVWVPRFAVALVAASALAGVVYYGGYDPREILAGVSWPVKATEQTEQVEQTEQSIPAGQTAQPAETAQTPVTQTSPAGASTPEPVEAKAGGDKEPVLAVVTAPPLKPPARTTAARSTSDAPSRSPDTKAMGSNSVCAQCGVVETVVAVHGYAQPQASGYQMHIRMDDGSVRTVEQRGALAAGSRVIVERGSVRALPDPAGQG